MLGLTYKTINTIKSFGCNLRRRDFNVSAPVNKSLINFTYKEITNKENGRRVSCVLHSVLDSCVFPNMPRSDGGALKRDAVASSGCNGCFQVTEQQALVHLLLD